MFGCAAPAHLSRALLHRVLVYRAQADVLGDLDRETARALDRLGTGAQGEIAMPERPGTKPGTLLVREGTLQRVMVLERGFAWNGQTYDSLSRVARHHRHGLERTEVLRPARPGRTRSCGWDEHRKAERGCSSGTVTGSEDRNTMKAERSHQGASAKILRCAIYTRVSTEHGLAQEFNSLDNQREAAEAYVKSQAHEGWRLLPGHYDDGGYSGGSLERPALQRLLAEVKAGRVDVVVVYKVDRLTRSLSDFASLVELFDRHGVSFVSVTQAFNTTTSMGRLTLNVLLSFAQFEREVTGERIRDKIAASKRKGIWMGGVVPLGYRVEARALHVVAEHAELIRTIYARYLELGSVSRVKTSLDDARMVVPVRVDGAGRQTGGGSFSRGHLTAILANPVYAGRLAHKREVHDGQHAAIVDLATWNDVQARLAANHRGHTARRLASLHLLIGRIRDGSGTTMSPTHAQKGSRQYRYYVSRALLEGHKDCDAASVTRVPAPKIEAEVVRALRASMPAPRQPTSDAELVAACLAHVSVHPDRLRLALANGADPIDVPWSRVPTRRWREIVVPAGTDRSTIRPINVEDRARILKAIATGRAWMGDLVADRVAGPFAIASRENTSERSVRMTLSLAQLSPTIVTAIVKARLTRGIGIRHLADLPPIWAEQHRALGL